MRVFVTGATGYLGTAIAARIARAGHQVYGLTRRADRAGSLAGRGITPVIGDLERPETFLSTLKNCDAAVHAARPAHDADQLDLGALASLRDAAIDGRVRRLLYTSVMWVYGDTADRTVDETTPLNPMVLAKWRAAHEEIALDLVDQEVDVVVFRPGIVYGGSRGIVGAMFAMTAEKGHVVWPGSGDQTWCMVHRDDLAEAYRLALDYAKGGERYVLVDDCAHRARDVAEAVGRAAGVPAKAWDRDQVVKDLGAFGEALMASQKASAAKARRELGWTPEHGSFVTQAEALYREWLDSRQTAVG